MTEEAQQESTPDQQVADMVNQQTPEDQQSSWHLADGIPGQGPQPEWFKADKYGNIAEQAKAYKELESKLGSFTGSPEEYNLKLSEELAEKGIEITKEDPLYEEAVKFAQESNMSQDGFDNMMNLYAMAKLAEQEAIQEHIQQEIQALGPLGQQRLDNLVAWGKANIPVDLFEGFEEMPQSAKAVQALEHIVAMTRSAPITPEGTVDNAGITEEDLRKMQFEKDEFGNRKIQTDRAFREKYERAKKQIWGDQDHRIVIGG